MLCPLLKTLCCMLLIICVCLEMLCLFEICHTMGTRDAGKLMVVIIRHELKLGGLCGQWMEVCFHIHLSGFLFIIPIHMPFSSIKNTHLQHKRHYQSLRTSM